MSRQQIIERVEVLAKTINTFLEGKVGEGFCSEKEASAALSATAGWWVAKSFNDRQRPIVVAAFESSVDSAVEAQSGGANFNTSTPGVFQ